MHDYLLTFYKPESAMRLLLAKKNYRKLGFYYILLPICGYTIMYFLLAASNAAPSVFTPRLNISKENYYSVNRFLLAPSLLLCWFTAAFYMQLISKLNGSTGTFKQTLSVVGLSISISMWGGLIHDLPVSILFATGFLDPQKHEIAMNSPGIARCILWICYSFYFLAFLVLFSTAVKVVHQLSKAKIILIGCTTFCIFQLLFLIFNR